MMACGDADGDDRPKMQHFQDIEMADYESNVLPTVTSRGIDVFPDHVLALIVLELTDDGTLTAHVCLWCRRFNLITMHQPMLWRYVTSHLTLDHTSAIATKRIRTFEGPSG